MDITNLSCRQVSVSSGYKEVLLEILGASESEILDLFDLSQIIGYFDKDEILELIGEDYCKEYFGIE